MTDINNQQLLDEPIEYNPDAEPAKSGKIPDGTYFMEVSVGKFGVDVRKTQAGVTYVQANIQGRIIAPGERYDGFIRNGSLSSLSFDDGTSSLQQFLVRAGNKTHCSTARQLVEATEEVLNSYPQVNMRLRWEASGKDDNNKRKYVKGMTKFPKDANGEYIPEVEINGETHTAFETIYAVGKETAAQAG